LTSFGEILSNSANGLFGTAPAPVAFSTAALEASFTELDVAVTKPTHSSMPGTTTAFDSVDGHSDSTVMPVSCSTPTRKRNKNQQLSSPRMMERISKADESEEEMDEDEDDD